MVASAAVACLLQSPRFVATFRPSRSLLPFPAQAASRKEHMQGYKHREVFRQYYAKVRAEARGR